MSQEHDEFINSIGSEDNDDTRTEHNDSASDSGSSSGSDSDSDSSTSSSGSSGGGRSSTEPPIRANDEADRYERDAPAQASAATTAATTTTSAIATATSAIGDHSLSEKSKLRQANGGYSDESGSDSNSGSNSDSNDGDVTTNHRRTSDKSRGENSFNESGITSTTLNSSNNNISSSTTNTTNNTNTTSGTNTANDLDSGEEDEANSGDDRESVVGMASKAKTSTAMTESRDVRMEDNNSIEVKIDDDDDDGDRRVTDAGDDDDEAEEEASESAESPSSVDSPTASSSSSSSSSEDDEDDYQPKRSTRQVRKPTSDTARKIVKKKRKKQNWNSEESGDSDGDSDEDSPPPRRRGGPTSKSSTSRHKQQKSKKAYSSDESEEDSKRFAKRRAAATVSYKETSDNEVTGSEDLVEIEYDESQMDLTETGEEDKSETIERVLAQRRGKKGCTGNQTTIYAIEEAEADPNAGVDENDLEQTEVQYLIKWKGWSHIHNTWESEESLREQKVKGIKKLDNFVKKEQELAYWRRSAGPEDIDYFECQLELQNDLLKSYNNVDRIISRNEKEAGSCEYLCKWESLPYSEATWEDAGLVMRKWSQRVEQFNDREMSKCTPSRHCKVLRSRPKFYKFKSQPDFIAEGLVLRDYQMDGLNWLLHSWCKENSVILADEMGLGKTVQAICFLYTLHKIHHLYGPFLCVVPLSTMTAWQRESVLWAPDMNVVTYLGDVKSREMIRQYEWQFDGSKRLKFNCILTTYEIVLKDKLFLGTLQWAALLVDEAHRLKNDDSLLYKSLKEFDTNHRLLITGTPLQNSLKELWALLHFIMPEKFDTWENFEAEHGNAADKGYTKLHQQLEPYILRRVKKDVEKSLPAKVEQILRVEMTSLQKQYYKWILTRNFDALRKGKRGSTSTFLNIVIELKKCCNHGALIRPSEFELTGMQQEEALQTLLKGSGKLVLLDKLLCRLKETGHRVLIFSQMVRMLDILADYLQKRHFSFQRLDGSIKGEMRRQALDHFNAEGSQDFCFLLSTRAGGLGINLATADTVIIFDSDWNPQNDLQAQARAHRIGQKNQVNIYRLVTARSVEEQIVERAKQKMVLDHLVIQRMDTTGRTVLDKSSPSSSNSTPFNKDDLSAILKFGAEELFKDEQENDEELVCDIDEILRRAETRNEDPEMPGDDLLSAFKVASIAAFEEEPSDTTKDYDAGGGDDDDTKDWDDIIPENIRKVVEDQERAKEMEDLYLPPRRKTAANSQDTPSKKGKKNQPVDDSADSDYELGSDASGDDGRPKRRGRPTNKEKIPGFTDAEIRRFIKSYKKFPAPIERLEAIACDAELQEKPLAELKRIGEMLHDRCVQFFEEHKDEMTNTPKNVVKSGGDDNAKQKRSRATYSVKLGGVSFNAKTLLSCEEELTPLNEIIPRTTAERQNWELDIKTRPANFDIDWGVEEDSKLLCGIYQYGIGSWEQMKMDPNLQLTDKILFNDTRKPQAKHLQSRAEYLLKIIKKNVELKKGVQKKPRKPRKTKDALGVRSGSSTIPATPENKARHFSESHGEDLSQSGDAERKLRNRDSSSKADPDHDAASNDVEAGTTKKKAKRSGAGGKANKAKTKETNKPMHFTANNEPRALEVLGDLDPNVFNECKEKMRPVKKALKALDRPDVNLSNQDKVQHTRECLLLIGKQIDLCLEEYKEPEKKEWRSNLWYFVSKFTEFDAKKLFKLYKYATKTGEDMPSASSTSNKEAKKSLDGRSDRNENGRIADDRDKNSKKKKRDKDKDRDRERDMGRSERFSGGGYDSLKQQQRMDLGTPLKRKRDENDFGPSGSSSITAGMPSFKRLHGIDNNRSRDDSRKKHHREDYYGGSNSHDGPNSSRGDRRSSMTSPSTPSSRSIHACSTPRLPPGGYTPGSDSRSTASPYIDSSDRWGHSRDRYGNDYKRDRYDSYSRGSSGGYRDHRDRDRDRRPDKRRYPPSHGPPIGYPSHYIPPPPYYMANGVLPPSGMPISAYRGDPRYLSSGDWSRDSYPPSDYRRSEYDRRQQT